MYRALLFPLAKERDLTWETKKEAAVVKTGKLYGVQGQTRKQVERLLNGSLSDFRVDRLILSATGELDE